FRSENALNVQRPALTLTLAPTLAALFAAATSSATRAHALRTLWGWTCSLTARVRARQRRAWSRSAGKSLKARTNRPVAAARHVRSLTPGRASTNQWAPFGRPKRVICACGFGNSAQLHVLESSPSQKERSKAGQDERQADHARSRRGALVASVR